MASEGLSPNFVYILDLYSCIFVTNLLSHSVFVCILIIFCNPLFMGVHIFFFQYMMFMINNGEVKLSSIYIYIYIYMSYVVE